ncbi:MAG: imidazole glycerol phosphate synthase subunit HisH [Prevotella sp.]|nr:imidazole glycerol phosphate synthase subunit HisH [Prevotella sp.]
MNVAIVKYNAGNIYSVVNALHRLGVEPTLTDSPELLMKADRVIFPGQGEASTAISYLREHQLDQVIKELRQPVLGICIGQQLLCAHSEEGDTECIGIFPVEVKRFNPTRHEDKVPCMGWQQLHHKTSPLFSGISDSPYVYFVHSYYVPLCEWTIATADYIAPYSAAIRKDNFTATQFHPEKSGKVGEQLLKNFLNQ